MQNLFNSNPIVVNRDIAKVLGLNETIVLQQINYWLEVNRKKNHNFRDGKYWTYNTIEEWREEFPFWSKETVKRIFKKLRDMNLLLTANYNTMKMDRTIWYSIDYEELKKLLPNAKEQNEPIQKAKITPPIPETSTKNSTKDINKSISQSNTIVKEEVVVREEKEERQIDRRNNPNNFNDDFKRILNNCYIDDLDETYRTAVSHAIKMLLLDIENNRKVKIGNTYIPSSVVKKDLERLDHFTIEYAINKFKEISKSVKIKNTISYLRTCIYNSINEKKIEIDARLRYEGLV